MRRTNYHHILVAASLLTPGCLCRHDKSDTTTVTTTAFLSPIQSAAEITGIPEPAPNAANQPLEPAPTPSLPEPPFIASLPTTSLPTTTSLPSGELFFTIAVAQAAIAEFAGNNEPPGIITIQPAKAVASPQAATLVTPISEPTGTTAAGSMTNSQAQTSTNTSPEIQEPAQTGPSDPAQDGFPGGNPPNATVDLPLTIVFLILYASGAATHISIFRANSKRGHKFLLSDLMFDFCMVRTVTTIFRIIWIFIQPRGIVLAAQIFFNGGAAVIFAVNIFLVQRIMRSMHPRFGWSTGFSIATRAMAISVPIIIIVQIVSLIVLFFSVNNPARLQAAQGVLKFGTSYNLFLSTFPFISISIACAIPGPKPEKFGTGSLRVKTSLVMFVSAILTTGATIRTYAFFNPRPPINDDVLYGKPIFYTTQFMLEIIVVALYAAMRFDLLFHIPNGSSGPGDYSRGRSGDAEKDALITREDIQERIEACQVPYQILSSSYSKNTATGASITGVDQPVYAVFFPELSGTAALQTLAVEEGQLPPRPMQRVSRRQSVMEVMGSRASRRVSQLPSSSFSPTSFGGLPANPRDVISPPVRPRRDTMRSMYLTRSMEQAPPPPPPLDYRDGYEKRM